MNKKIILVITTAFVISLIGLFILFNSNKTTFQDGLSEGVTSEEIAGSRMEFVLTNINDEDITEVIFNYTYSGLTSNLTSKMSQEENEFMVKIKTPENISEINYSFLVYTENKTYNYPETGTFSVQLDTSTTFPLEIVHTPLNFDELSELDVYDLEFYIPDNFPFTEINLKYKLNNAQEYSTSALTYSGSYTASISIPNVLTELSYYLEVVSRGETLRYPVENDYTIVNPNVETLISQITSMAENENDLVMFSLGDQYENLISYNGTREVGSLSIIKVLVMIEVYNQLEQNKISLNDSVSGFGYSGTVQNALKSMMTVSSNEATGALILKVGGVSVINPTIKQYLGEDSTTFIGYIPGVNYTGKVIGNNVVTTNELVELFGMINDLEVISEESSSNMLSLMKNCSDYFGIKQIPGITTVAMKTGYYPDIMYGLAGIVYLDNGEYYIFSVYLDNWDSRDHIETSTLRTIVQYLHEFYIAELE